MKYLNLFNSEVFSSHVNPPVRSLLCGMSTTMLGMSIPLTEEQAPTEDSPQNAERPPSVSIYIEPDLL